MTPLFSAVTLLLINLGLLWLLMAAPIGRRTITLSRNIRLPAPQLWRNLHPGADEATWNPSVLSSRPLAGDCGRIEVVYRQPGRDGAPIRRLLAVKQQTDPDHDTYRSAAHVIDDSALDVSFWKDFEETRSIAPGHGGSRLTFAQTDRYRGIAFLVFRYFMLRRQMRSLESWLETGSARSGGMFEHPLTQIFLATLSTLLLWPFLGLNTAGLTISVALTLVIVLHELGHLVAYRAFGHRQVKIIFMPLLGGLAIGGRPYNSRFEVATCALMGAGVSGFLVPMFVAVYDLANAHILPRGIRDPSMVFLLILGAFNLLNLLPMHRFDGGQILRQVFDSRRMLIAGSFGITLLMLWVGFRIGLSLNALMASLSVFILVSLIGARSIKPRHNLAPMQPGERLMAGFGLYAAVLLHSYAIIFACDRLFG
jgi:Zn-dependent protease